MAAHSSRHIEVLLPSSAGSPSTYSAAVLADSPVAYYRLNEASGQPQDSSGNGNHTTATGGTPTYGVTGGIDSDPTDDAVGLTASSSEGFLAPHHASLDLGDVFTIEAWVKIRAATESTTRGILSKGGNAYYLRLQSDDTVALLRSGVAEMRYSSVTVTDDGLWHHIVATKNGSTRTIYVDGVDVSTGGSDSTCIDNTNALAIGSDQAPLGEYGDLDIDEVAVYGTALTSTRVVAHFDAAQAVVIPDVTMAPMVPA